MIMFNTIFGDIILDVEEPLDWDKGFDISDTFILWLSKYDLLCVSGKVQV